MEVYFDELKAKVLKEKFEQFKQTDAYINRLTQTIFCSTARDIILNSINQNSFSREHLNAFIQLFRVDGKYETFKDKLKVVIEEQSIFDKILADYEQHKQTGYTAVGKASLSEKVDVGHIRIIKDFLFKISKVETSDEIREILKDYVDKDVPECKGGVYSPWIHYLKPNLCPIKTSRVNNFFERFLKIKTPAYIVFFEYLLRIKEILGEEDFGIIDQFITDHELWLKSTQGEPPMTDDLTRNLTNLLKSTHNLILHGAPGTGKTHLAREIAETMGAEVGFVQFHPSYDYTDFVEGLRPVNDGNSGQIGFERKDGVFKKFCERALKNFYDSKKSASEIEKEISIDEKISSFVSDAIENNTEFEIVTGNKFFITDMTDKSIVISIPANEKTNELSLPRNELKTLLSAEKSIENGNDIRTFFNRKWRTQQDSYNLVLYKKIETMKTPDKNSEISRMELKNFVFIIDEINRGDMSKIFGELFFAIEPGYRGAEKCNSLRTQYANLQSEPNAFDEVLKITDSDNFGHFFIPENVYIIGTMNDIDRGVESMDFAFRRRFTFVEVKASDRIEMLNELDEKIREEAKSRMSALNNAIWDDEKKSGIDGLSSSYHIGGAYFLKLKELDNDFDKLWEYHLAPLLKEYLRGMENEDEKFDALKKAYDNPQVSSEEE